MGMSGRWFVSDLELRTVEVIGAAVLNVFVPDLMATESTASDVGSGIAGCINNYNDLTATSLESWLIRGIIPKWPNFSG